MSDEIKQPEFKFAMNQIVHLTGSYSGGAVRARIEYASGALCYLVSSVDANGVYREPWIDEELLSPGAPPPRGVNICQ